MCIVDHNMAAERVHEEPVIEVAQRHGTIFRYLLYEGRRKAIAHPYIEISTKFIGFRGLLLICSRDEESTGN